MGAPGRRPHWAITRQMGRQRTLRSHPPSSYLRSSMVRVANHSPNHLAYSANFGLIRHPFPARLCPDRMARQFRNLLISNVYDQPSRRTVNCPCARCMTAALTYFRCTATATFADPRRLTDGGGMARSGTKLPSVADQSNGSFRRPTCQSGSDVDDLVPSAYVGGRSAYAGRKAEPDEARGRQGAPQAVGTIIRGPMICPAYRDPCSSSSKP